MNYIVYETTNLVNGKYYVGIHKQKNIVFDEYLGSGKILGLAIKKYGKKKFMRETLNVYDNLEEAYAKEKEIVNFDFVKNRNTYNACGGGNGPSIHSAETKLKISKSLTGEKNNRYGKHHSEESKRKISEGNRGKTVSKEVRDRISESHIGKTKSAETKSRMSISGKKRKPMPIIKCPHCEVQCRNRGAMNRWHFENCKNGGK